MRSSILVVLAFLAACPADRKESQDTPETEIKIERPVAIDPNYPACVTRSCLEGREGERVQIEGTFEAAEEGAFALNKLALSDDTTVILPSSRSVSELQSEVDGKKMKIRGRVFTKNIPDKYNILGRTPEPYLLDIVGVDIE